MKILICGSREWGDKLTIYNKLKALMADTQDLTVIEGEARGADRLGRICAEELGLKVISVPADWDKFGRSAGPIRNRVMLDLQPDLVLAFHSDIENSKGTKDCVQEARKRGIPVEIIVGVSL